jgi:hypothetical protein
MTQDDAFINPELELQIHQSNIAAGASYDAVQLQQSIDRTDGLLECIKTDTEAAASLEAMGKFIKDKKVDKTSAILFNIASESYGNLHTLNSPKITFALEDFKIEDHLSQRQVDAAIENLKINSQEIIARINSRINETMVSLGDIVHGFDKNLLNVKKRVSFLENLLEEIKNKEDLAYNYVKPENEYTYLMYTQEGFANGMGPVIDDIDWLLSEHADMVGDSIGIYKQWFNDHKKDMTNPAVINGLEFDKKYFIISGSTVFNKSVGDRLPSKGNSFYRTKEIPGGKCLYCEVRTENQHGTQAIDALLDVKYFMDYFQPDSFNITKKRLYGAAALGTLAWASLMVASPLPIALYGLAAMKISDSTKTVDIKKVRITPDTVFPVLDKDQLQGLVLDLKKIIITLEKWNKAVYLNVWKDRSIQEALRELSNIKKEDNQDLNGLDNIRHLAIAIISLMGKSYTKVHSHSFHVINAALSYAEKSARQYK